MPSTAPRAVVLPAALVVLLAGAAALAVEAARGWSALVAGPPAVDGAVATGAAALGALVAAWLAVGALVSAWSLLAGSGRRPAVVPAAVHRTVALLLGVVVAAGPVGSPGSPAPGVPDPGWAPTTPREVAAPVRVAQVLVDPVLVDPVLVDPVLVDPVQVDPGWRPTQPPAQVPRSVAQPIDPILLGATRQPPDPGDPVTVRRGDTLWDLAARHLGPGATDAEIATEWPRWFAANREIIGADPDLLLPGRQLVPPERVNGT